MQAARLIGTSRLLRATRTNIPFFNQPNFYSGNFSLGHRRTKRLFHQSIQRPFLREVEQHTGGKIGIESCVKAVVAGIFHRPIFAVREAALAESCYQPPEAGGGRKPTPASSTCRIRY